ncbi:hypothetical protein RI103_06185 [Paraburkholderia sp. FT54]|uniref:hypothetical protein n=1 Tax=Paraburkholderia sp. FT54 TaxID=3074437 RepID=UPI002877F881|nr:hypothetical protein [Paraburkholderia sp. FT54]WNC90936.1 hypothetical protein RI103_06185 [Paraburkholderia sp. FT54]
MQLFVNVPLKSLRKVAGRAQSTYYSGWFKAVRLIGPERTNWYRGQGSGYIWADIELDEDVRQHADCIFREDGTVRIQVWVNTHRKTLAAFLASGDLEWDVREMA